MTFPRRVFPESFKREVVDRVANSGLTAGAVARELGLHETVLRRCDLPPSGPAVIMGVRRLYS